MDLKSTFDSERALVVLFLVVAGYMFLRSESFGSTAGLFPRLTAGVVLVGAVLLLLQDRLPGWLRTFVAEPSSLIKTNKDFTSEFEEGDGEEEAATGMVERDVDRPLEPSTFTAVAVGLYVVTSFFFGLLWMSPIFAVVYSRWFEQSWLTTAFLAALTFAMGWAFMSVLNLPLTEGALLSVPLVGGL
jgi:hypothetical protein